MSLQSSVKAGGGGGDITFIKISSASGSAGVISAEDYEKYNVFWFGNPLRTSDANCFLIQKPLGFYNNRHSCYFYQYSRNKWVKVRIDIVHNNDGTYTFSPQGWTVTNTGVYVAEGA